MLERVDAAVARRWAAVAQTALGEAREEIDALNVYPVPDGDTGTNLYLTLESGRAAVEQFDPGAGLGELADGFARGALRGARGNSGVILAQLLRGWADVVAERRVLDAAAAKAAFRRADEQAWTAVGDPVHGTILSVSRAAASAAEAAGDRLADVVGAATAAAGEALARTPLQLETLRRAGVVDAGGRGLVVLLGALDLVVAGRALARRGRGGHRLPVPVPREHCPPELLDGPAYEVMYLLDAGDPSVAALRAQLAAMGESVVVVGGDGLWHVHVHVDDPGAAVEAGIHAGHPHEVRITHLAPPGHAAARRPPARAGARLVACAAGPGLAALFERAGAVVVPSRPGHRPTTGDLLDAVRRTGSDTVALLPNAPDTIAVAEAAAALARDDGIRVSVLATRAQVQGLAAAAVHEEGRDAEDDVLRMSAAAAGARYGGVTVATAEAFTSAGRCRSGDALGAVDGDFTVVGDDLAGVAVQVVERMLGSGGELVTLVTGQDADPALVGSVTAHLRRTRRDLEVEVLDGGQPRYPLLIGVE